MNPYYLIYYWIYKATRKTNKDVVEWTSMITLSALSFFNILTIFVIISPQFLKQIASKGLFITSSIALMIINYFIFIYQDKYRKIVREYSEKKVINSLMVGILILIYIACSVYYMIYFLRRMPVQ